MRKTRQPASIYQLKITLIGTRPPVWRRILVPSDLRLSELHPIIQSGMGWTNAHLHYFKVGHETYEPRSEFGPDDLDLGLDDLDEESESLDSATIRLFQALEAPGSHMAYLYDFGDAWHHKILLEKILPVDPDVRYPICVKGVRACPPEDSGGIWGYSELLSRIDDDDFEEEYGELVGEKFDPNFCDLEAVNQRLSRSHSRS